MRTNIVLDDSLWRLARTIDPKAKPIERYVGLAFTQNFQKHSKGLDPTFSTFSLNTLREKMTAELQLYDKYTTVDFYPHEKGLCYSTNLNMIFSTPRGNLYGHYPGLLRSLFYTRHCIDRFAQRIRPTRYKPIVDEFMLRHGRMPTPLEVLDELIIMHMPHLEFGLGSNTQVWLNIGVGILALESYERCYVAKTFTWHNYASDNACWYKTRITERRAFYDLKGLLNSESERCIPTFVNSITKGMNNG